LDTSRRRSLTAVALHRGQDTIYEEHLVLLRGSSLELVADIFSSKHQASKVDVKRLTVGTQFQMSLE
jgi:myosin-5